MKNFTNEEFVDYIKKLEFNELEDCAAFAIEYYNFYLNTPETNKEEKDNAWTKYVIIISKFGMMFASFTAAVIEFRKKLNAEIAAEKAENSSGRALENGTK